MPKVAHIKGSPAVATARAGWGSNPDDGANDTHAPWTRRMEEVTAYHQAILGRSGAGDGRTQLSFQALYPRRTNRPAQVEASRKFRGRCKIRYENVWSDGDALDPGSFVWSRINTKDKMFSIDNHRCHLYWEEVQRKSGVACHGDTRTAAGYGADAKLASSIDLDNMPEQSQRKMTKKTLRIAEKSGCEDHPMTLGEFLSIDMDGVSAPTQMVFRAMTKEYDECMIVGGAFKVWGVLRAVVRKILESGQQESLRERGIEITGDLHEMVNNDTASYGARLDHRVTCDVDEAMQAIFSTPEEWAAASRMSLKLKLMLLAWAPGRLASCPVLFLEAKMAVAKKVAGEGVPILDAFEDWPVPDPQTYADCQAPEKFTKEQSWGAVNKTLDVLVRPLELYGGLGAADENFHAFKVTKSGNMVDYLTKEHTSNVGKWFVAWTFPGIVVLKMVYVGDGFLRILLVFIPWCKMMCSKSGETIQWWDLLAHETSGLSAHWAYTFFRVLEEPNSSLVANKSLSRLLEDNIAFQFGIYVSDLMFAGLCPKTCALFFKNRLEGEKANLFHPDHSNLLRKRDFDIFGYHCRNKRARYADEELVDDKVAKKQKVTRDNKFVMGALMQASYEEDDDDEMVESLLYSIEHDRLHDDAKCNSDKARGRREAILAKDKAIPRAVRDKLQAEYDATRQNAGNRSNHSSVSDEQMKATDRALQHWNGRQGTAAKKFFVMGRGSAKQPQPKNNDKTPFVVPADGTVLQPERPGQAPVVFRKADFVPGITYNGLLERCKPMKTEGKTNSKQCVKFPNDRIHFTDGIMRYTSKTWHWCNGYNVVEVWFEPEKNKRPKKS